MPKIQIYAFVVFFNLQICHF